MNIIQAISCKILQSWILKLYFYTHFYNLSNTLIGIFELNIHYLSRNCHQHLYSPGTLLNECIILYCNILCPDINNCEGIFQHSLNLLHIDLSCNILISTRKSNHSSRDISLFLLNILMGGHILIAMCSRRLIQCIID